MAYCRNCGEEITEGQSYCLECGTETDDLVEESNTDPEVEENARTLRESARVVFNYYMYPENRSKTTMHIALILLTAGAWFAWFLVVWLEVWSGDSSINADKFNDDKVFGIL